jgi:uncharacterized membrane protein YhhN
VSLSPRQKFAWGMVIFVAVGLAIAIAAGEYAGQSQVPMVMFFAWCGIGSLLLMQIRCPRCGTPVVYQGKLGKLSVYAGFVRRHCQNCGDDLDKKT